MTTHSTREAWLNAAVSALKAEVFPASSNVPGNLRVSVGFPSRRGSAKSNQRIGECWSPKASADGHHEIFISPVTDDATRVLDILCHEMVHAAVGTECGHKGAFKALAVKIGLTGKMTAAVADAALYRDLRAKRITAKRFTLRAQVREYWEFGVPCGMVCKGYGINW